MRSEQEVLRQLRSFARNEHRTKRATRTEVRMLTSSSAVTRGPLPALNIRETGPVGFVIVSYQGQELRIYGFSRNGQLLFGDTHRGSNCQQIEKTLRKASKIRYRIPLPTKRETPTARATRKFETQFENQLSRIARRVHRKPQKKFAISFLKADIESSDLEFDCSFSNDIVRLSPGRSEDELLPYWIAACCFIPKKMQIFPVLADLASLATMRLVKKSLRQKMLLEWEKRAVIRESLSSEEFSTVVAELANRRMSANAIIGFLHKICRWLDYNIPNSSSSTILRFIQQKTETPSLGEVGEVLWQLSKCGDQRSKIDLIQRAILCEYLDAPHSFVFSKSLEDSKLALNFLKLSKSLEDADLTMFLEVTKGIRKKKTPMLFGLREQVFEMLAKSSIEIAILISEDGSVQLDFHNRSDFPLENLTLQDVSSNESFMLLDDFSKRTKKKIPWPTNLAQPNERNYHFRFEIPDVRKWGISQRVFEIPLSEILDP
ncbi:MAG: hypothetical protein ACE5OZ_20450 [Candidatus Heimdallarchaeota archaeon]